MRHTIGASDSRSGFCSSLHIAATRNDGDAGVIGAFGPIEQWLPFIS